MGRYLCFLTSFYDFPICHYFYYSVVCTICNSTYSLAKSNEEPGYFLIGVTTSKMDMNFNRNKTGFLKSLKTGGR